MSIISFMQNREKLLNVNIKDISVLSMNLNHEKYFIYFVTEEISDQSILRNAKKSKLIKITLTK